MASTAIITDLKSATTTAFGATAEAAALAAAGPIMDLDGLANLAVLKAQELKVLLNQICGPAAAGYAAGPVQSGDPNYTALNNVRLTLV